MLREMRIDGSWVMLTVPLLLGAAPSAADPAEKIENERYAVERLALAEPCCPAIVALRVTDKAHGGLREVAVSARVESVGRIFFGHGATLVVEGELRYGGSNLLIVDLERGELLDEIWSYGHAFSPSGRYLVYRTHYPRQIVPEARRSIVMLYDLALSPDANRFAVDPRDPQKGIGLPVFPKANAERLSFDVALAGDRLWVSPFLWARDERAVLFIECAPEWASCHLVEVEIGEEVAGGDRATSILRRELDLHPYTRPDGAGPFTGGPDDPVRIAVEEMRWNQDGSAVVVYPEEASSMVARFELPRPGS